MKTWGLQPSRYSRHLGGTHTGWPMERSLGVSPATAHDSKPSRLRTPKVVAKKFPTIDRSSWPPRSMVSSCCGNCEWQL